MFPTLLEVFGEPLPAYFTLLVLGFALATFLAARGATRLGLDREVMIDVGLYSLIWGVAGGRVLHVLADGYFWDYVHLCTDPSKVAWHITREQCTNVAGIWDRAAEVCRPAERNCFAWAEFWRGGLAYYGGLVAALAFGTWFLRKERFPIGKGLDLVGMVLPVGLFFGRMGCFLGGCCFGVRHDGPLAVRFPAWSPASESQWREHLLSSPGLPSLPVHPAQLYEAIGCLGIGAFLFFYLHGRKRFDGQIMLAFLGLYAVLRFALEYVRADDRGGFAGLSTSQWISVVAVAAVAATWGWARRRATERALTA
ncbi:MAG: prolipoprotein diacylglyceryl transferase [Polyangiales bacterium]